MSVEGYRDRSTHFGSSSRSSLSFRQYQCNISLRQSPIVRQTLATSYQGERKTIPRGMDALESSAYDARMIDWTWKDTRPLDVDDLAHIDDTWRIEVGDRVWRRAWRID
jgi:hypothetical protein